MQGNRERTLSEAQRLLTMPSSEFSDCLGKWMLVFNRVYRQPMTDVTIWAYRETLADLTPEELERGCREAMKRTKFTPTPAEIREYGVLPAPEIPALKAPVDPPLTAEEARDFLAKLKQDVPCLSNESIRSDGIVIVTDAMRAQAKAKNQEALKRFRAAS